MIAAELPEGHDGSKGLLSVDVYFHFVANLIEQKRSLLLCQLASLQPHDALLGKWLILNPLVL